MHILAECIRVLVQVGVTVHEHEGVISGGGLQDFTEAPLREFRDCTGATVTILVNEL